jgi:hypothetical protein
MRQILCPVVVGRHEELDLLHAALDEAREGRGRLVLIRGEAGVGKSRLTLQLEAAARSAGMQVLRGRAAASNSSVPFRPFAEALLGATRAAEPPEAPELAAYRSVLALLIPEWSKEGPPVADRGLLLHEAALRLLRVLAGAVGAQVVTIPAEPADPDLLPPALKPFGAVPPLVSDIDLSVDDRWLYVSCWGTGELRQYDVADPFHPRETGSVQLGGIVRRQPHPAAPGSGSAADRRWSRSAATAAARATPRLGCASGTPDSTVPDTAPPRTAPPPPWTTAWRGAAHRRRRGGCPGSWRPA